MLDVANLYAAYGRKTKAYALRALGTDLRSYADDVSQEVWIAILRGGYFPDLLAPPYPEHLRLRFLWVIVRRTASRVRRSVLSEAAKAALVRDGEQLTAGRRTLTRNKCGVCGRPTKGRADLCEAHYTRRRRGTETGQSVQTWRKLSNEDVAAIRERLTAGESGVSLAREFGVGKILAICELADLYGALRACTDGYGVTMEDLATMADATERAFKSGERK